MAMHGVIAQVEDLIASGDVGAAATVLDEAELKVWLAERAWHGMQEGRRGFDSALGSAQHPAGPCHTGFRSPPDLQMPEEFECAGWPHVLHLLLLIHEQRL